MAFVSANARRSEFLGALGGSALDWCVIAKGFAFSHRQNHILDCQIPFQLYQILQNLSMYILSSSDYSNPIPKSPKSLGIETCTTFNIGLSGT